jgi:hypothetical protein
VDAVSVYKCLDLGSRLPPFAQQLTGARITPDEFKQDRAVGGLAICNRVIGNVVLDVTPVRRAAELQIEQIPPELARECVGPDVPLRWIAHLRGHIFMEMLDGLRRIQATETPPHDHASTHLDPQSANRRNRIGDGGHPAFQSRHQRCRFM